MKEIRPYERKVNYYETDKMGIVHHSNYIRMLEESRCDFLEQAGVSYFRIEELGLMIPVLNVESKFIKPLKFGDTFTVYTSVTKFNGVRLEMSYRILNSETNVLCCEAKSSHCFTDENLKPISIKLKYPDIYKVFLDYLNYEISMT
ncbi:MAG: acyl-CoA thioesterase [Oscillospiraceae bacterium]|nr:acyl-CoA thioesterase [Oscillospiraceae bacterium]